MTEEEENDRATDCIILNRRMTEQWTGGQRNIRQNNCRKLHREHKNIGQKCAQNTVPEDVRCIGGIRILNGIKAEYCTKGRQNITPKKSRTPDRKTAELSRRQEI
jgi:hypothetical protein